MGRSGGETAAKESTREKQRGEVRPGAVTLLVLEHLHSGQVSHNYVNYFTTQLRARRGDGNSISALVAAHVCRVASFVSLG